MVKQATNAILMGLKKGKNCYIYSLSSLVLINLSIFFLNLQEKKATKKYNKVW